MHGSDRIIIGTLARSPVWRIIVRVEVIYAGCYCTFKEIHIKNLISKSDHIQVFSLSI